MYSKHINDLKEVLKTSTDIELQEAITKGALMLNDTQITTVSFVFWLIYSVEMNMDEAIKSAWEVSTRGGTSAEIDHLKDQLWQKIGGKRVFDVAAPEYFSQKVRVHQAIFGETEQSKLLWKFNDIRNDLSHRRINDLKYNGEPLSKREVKEKALLDYLEAAVNPDFSQADFWKKMNDAEKAEFLLGFEKLNQELEERKQMFIQADNKE